MDRKVKFTLINVVILILLSVCLAGCGFFNAPNDKYQLKVPNADEIVSINFGENGTITDTDKIAEIVKILSFDGKGRKTGSDSNNDFPVNAENLFKVVIESENSEHSTTLFVYKRKDGFLSKGKYRLEQPYNGIYEISEDEYNKLLQIMQEVVNK